MIPLKRNCKTPRDWDRALYKARYLIENFFVKLKPYRAIFTRHDKLVETFLRSQRYLYGYRATSIIWLIWSHALGR